MILSTIIPQPLHKNVMVTSDILLKNVYHLKKIFAMLNELTLISAILALANIREKSFTMLEGDCENLVSNVVNDGSLKHTLKHMTYVHYSLVTKP